MYKWSKYKKMFIIAYVFIIIILITNINKINKLFIYVNIDEGITLK